LRLEEKYDIIGDIHGYATTNSRLLLTKLGYRVEDGAYRHPERKVIFLGDFIDRGPEIRETLQTVRAMVDGGSALAVMGNHEFNALAYHTPDGQGDYLRKHTPEKIEQHRATMEQLGTPYPDEWKGWLEWFSTLPLFLDLGHLRAVHASWDAEAVNAFQSIKRIDEETLRAMAPKGSPSISIRRLFSTEWN
jgi:predicted MPP superfamily phosphohydrolase